MKFKAFAFLATISLALAACSMQKNQHQTTKNSRFSHHINAEGPISINELQTNFPIFNGNAAYQPLQASINRFNAVATPTEIKVFLGTWCHDSQREVPNLIKFYRSIDNPNVTLSMVALDTSKNDSKGLAKQAGVQYTPTFILYQNGQELGRVVERSDGPIDIQLTKMLP